MPKIRCAVSRKFHDIDALMVMMVPRPIWQAAVADLQHGQQQIHQAMDTGFDSLSHQLRTLMSQADEQFVALLATLGDPAQEGPRLFSLTPVAPGFWDKPNWVGQKMRLTLWCEHSRLPLPVLDGDGNGQEGSMR